jgi:peptidoglycan/LPS O-acetylase OafA/YrhL
VNAAHSSKIESYPHFDWLRLVLASIVALGHAGLVMPGPIDGGLAVDIFLALSGWLIGGILLETQRQELPRFFYNRAMRIWIPYLLAMILIYGLAAVRDGIDLNWFKYLFYDLTFTHHTWTVFPQAAKELPLGGTGNHFWSISVEEQFYLAAPLILIFLPFGRAPWTWLAIAVMLIASQSIFAPIALGVLAASAFAHFKGMEAAQQFWSRYHLQIRTLLAVLSVALFALLFVEDSKWARAIFSIFFVLAVAIPGNRGKIGLIAGAISYPFYLNHWVGVYFANALNKIIAPLPWPLWLALGFFVSLAFSYVAWYIVDRQVLARRESLYTLERAKILTGIAYGLLALGLVGGALIRWWPS